MIEKDDIEDLFRKEIKDNITEEKPRPMVWQKIERELQPKTKEPLRLLINNVWFSVGFFALIAIPYFFFLIQNLENKEKSNTNLTFDEKERNKKDSIVNIENNSEPIVLNEVKRFNKPTDLEINKNDKNKQFRKLQDSINNLTDSINYVLADSVESDTLFVSDQIFVAEEEEKSNLNKIDKSKEPIIFYRDRIVLQGKINHVSFFLTENINDRLVFEKNGHKLYLTRKDGIIKVLTNSEKIKSELLNLVYINRIKIFDYYSKLN